jgi:ornithine carbamoyltransferase
MRKDFLSILDLSAAEIRRLIDEAMRLKKEHRAGKRNRSLEGRTLGMLFTKPSTRTRLSFQVGMTQLGGSTVPLNPGEIQLNRSETLEDTARVVSRFLDGIVIRTFAQAELEAWAAAATIPVINGLSDFSHPCQILADLLTIRETRGTLERIKVAYIGDGNNVAHSWILASGLLGLDFVLAAPAGYDPDPGVLAEAQRFWKGRGLPPRIVRDPAEAAAGADFLYTDVWTSMGQESETKRRLKAFRGFQIDAKLLARAKPNAGVLHCLPAHRGEEIAAEVIDGPQSLVLDQAENRLHAQKALLVRLLGTRKSPPAFSSGGGKKGK